MMNIKEKVTENLSKIVKDLGVNLELVFVEEPQDLQHGDLTSNVALQISKELKLSPREIAEKIVSVYPEDADISKVEVAGPGFINFYYSDKYLNFLVKNITEKGEEAFSIDINKGKKYVIEYTDPNPFKILHIGHLYTNMVGESFARLQEALGAQVYRANYQGDVGLHVAKTLYGLQLLLSKDGIQFSGLKARNLVDRVKYLGEAYMLGFNHYDDLKDPDAISRIKDINYYIFSLYIPSLEKKNSFQEFETEGLKEMYYEGKDWCMEYFERIYARTGTKFDYYFLESEISSKGLEIVKENSDGKGNDVFKSDDGAIIYEGDQSKGLHTRVFVNGDGLPTYEAKDLALAFLKFEKIKFDESVIITADEQSAYFKVVLDALSQIDALIASRTKHFAHGMVKLPGAEKMSSRKGKIIEGEWLLDETKKKVSEIMSSSGKWSEEEISNISDVIGVAAIKYAFLKVSVGKDVIFDFEKSISFDGDTGPYLQYVYARCKSLLDAGGAYGIAGDAMVGNAAVEDLLRTLSKYEGVLLVSANNYSPSTLCTYLFNLGQVFNKFYQEVRILDSEEKEYLLGLVQATAITMKSGLKVLGINTVDHM